MTKRAFEEAVMKTAGIPIVDAASFFLSVRRFPPAPSELDKTAGWQDPPDESGTMEGAFALPVPQVVALMGTCATLMMRLMNASLIYSSSARGPMAKDVRCSLESSQWSHRSMLEWLIQRMSVLAGPPHLMDPEAPPASTQPVEIAKRMIRAHQELIASLRALHEALGENTSKSRVSDCMRGCQDTIDDLWRALPPEVAQSEEMAALAPAPAAAEPPLPAEAAELPPAAAEGVPGELAEEPAPEPDKKPSPPKDKPEKSEEKTAAMDMPLGIMVGAPKKALDLAYEQGLEPGVISTVGGTLGSMAGYRRGARVGRGLEGAVQGALGGGLGASGGATLGALGGGLGGAALGAGGAYLLGANPVQGALLGGGAGLLGGGLAGAVKGGKSGYEYMTEGLDQPVLQPKTAAKAEADTDLSTAVKDQATKGRLAAVQGAARSEAMSRHQRGERAGDVVGRTGGTLAGAYLGKKLIGGPVGTVGGGALGYLVGGKAGKELGTEVDIHREKRADGMGAATLRGVRTGWEGEPTPAAPKSHALGGAALGSLIGRYGGAAIGAGGASMLGLDPIVGGLIGAGTGLAAGGGIGYLVGKHHGQDKAASIDMSVIADRMVARVKLAEGEDMTGEATMSAPTVQPEQQATNYLLAEQVGQQSQHANEIAFFKGRAQKAMQQAMAAMQQSQQQSEAMAAQMQELQQRADSAQQSITSALGEATAARDDALRQTQLAANMRMGMQKLRQQMIEISSQDPVAVAAQELDAVGQQAQQQVQQQAAMEAQAQIPDAGMVPPAADPGPAAQAPAPQSAPGSAPAAGSPDMNANAGGAPGPQGEVEELPQATNKESSVKLAGLLGAGAGAVVGGGLALHGASQAMGGPGPLRDRLMVLEQTQDGSYAKAAELAKVKKSIVDSELAEGHPGQYGLRATARGAALGALQGHMLENAVSRGVSPGTAANYQKNLNNLRAR